MQYKSYNEMVDTFLKNDSTEVFGNFSPEHAKYIIIKFLESARKSVDILSGSFSDAFYDGNGIFSVLKHVAKKLSEVDGKIRIITVNGEVNEKLNSIVEEINTELNRNVISYIPTCYKGKGPLKHFLVIDGKRYRLESEHKTIPEGQLPESVKAEVCCNGEEKASALISFFDNVYRIVSNPDVVTG